MTKSFFFFFSPSHDNHNRYDICSLVMGHMMEDVLFRDTHNYVLGMLQVRYDRTDGWVETNQI